MQLNAVFLCSLFVFVALDTIKQVGSLIYVGIGNELIWNFFCLLERAALFYWLYFSEVVKLVTELPEGLSRRFCTFSLTW